MDSIGWLLVGASYIAESRMLPAIRSSRRSDVVAICSRSAERAQTLASAHGVSRGYSDLDAALHDPDVDVVYVGGTNELHAPVAVAAAAAGKHVLCEKPIALSLDDGFEIEASCRRHGVVLGVNHVKRQAPTLRAMRHAIAEGAVGQPLAARVFFTTALPVHQQTWRVDATAPGSGVILDLTVHDVDLLRFLLGDEVESVAALGTQQGLATGTTEDSVMGALRFRSGLLASFHDSFTVPHAGTGLEVHGTAGSLVGIDVMGDDPTGEVVLKREGTLTLLDVGRRDDLFARAVADFNGAVIGAAAPAVGGEDGIWSLAVALAARESAREQRTVEIGTLDPRLAAMRVSATRPLERALDGRTP